MKYLVIDTETVGILNRIEISEEELKELGYSKKEELKIVSSLGYILVENGKIIQKGTTLCKPDLNPNSYTMEVNHITLKMLKNTKKLEDTKVFKDLQELLNEKIVIIGHNIKFDISVLNPYGLDLEKYQSIDTLQLSKKYFNNDSNRLTYLFYEYGIYKNINEYIKENKFSKDLKPHEALYDCLITHQILEYIMKEKNISFEELIKSSNENILLTIMPFGKHKGKLIKDLDDNYIIYFIKNDIDDINLKYTFEVEIENRGGLKKVLTNQNMYFIERLVKEDLKNDKFKKVLNEVFEEKKEKELIFSYGKYKDKSFQEIQEIDPSYISFLYDNNKLFPHVI